MKLAAHLLILVTVTAVNIPKSAATGATSPAECFQCVEDSARGIKCNHQNNTVQCDPTQPYCVTHYQRNNSHYVIDRGCSTQQKCFSEWWMKTRLSVECLRTDLLQRAPRDPLDCYFCCHPPLCNHPNQVMPNLAIMTTKAITTSTEASTTTSTTTTQTPTTTFKKTTVTTVITTTAAATRTTQKPIDCYENNHKRRCTSGYCLTTVIDNDGFNRAVIKKCVDRHECYTKWWLQTSEDDVCLDLMLRGDKPSGLNIVCSYCCQGDECNKNLYPPQNTLFNGKLSE